MPVTLQAANEATETHAQSAAPVVLAPRGGTMPRDRRWRLTGLLTRVLRTGYHDPLFERPDLIEDDYYRFLHQPRG